MAKNRIIQGYIMKVGDLVKVGAFPGVGLILSLKSPFGCIPAYVKVLLNGAVRWEQSHIVEVISESR
jgi:hypothetical protein